MGGTRDGYFFTVTEGPFFGLSGEKIATHRIVAYPDVGLIPFEDTERNTEEGDPMDEIHGTVKGINEPGVFMPGCLVHAFFGDDGVMGNSRSISSMIMSEIPVDLGHQIDSACARRSAFSRSSP